MGWLIGPESIIKPTLAASTRTVFCTNQPLQEAAAAGLERAKALNFFLTQTKEFAERRNLLLKIFDDLGMKYTLPQGSYFVLLVRRSIVPSSPHQSLRCSSLSNPQDISDIDVPDGYPFPESLNGRGRDFKYVSQSNNIPRSRFGSRFSRASWFIATELGVSSIPVSEVSFHLGLRPVSIDVPRKFYCKEHRSIGEGYARFAFCKDVGTLRAAGERLKHITKHLRVKQNPSANQLVRCDSGAGVKNPTIVYRPVVLSAFAVGLWNWVVWLLWNWVVGLLWDDATQKFSSAQNLRDLTRN